MVVHASHLYKNPLCIHKLHQQPSLQLPCRTTIPQSHSTIEAIDTLQLLDQLHVMLLSGGRGEFILGSDLLPRIVFVFLLFNPLSSA